MGAAKKPRLPSEFQEVEWVSNAGSVGAAYINTGIFPYQMKATCVFSGVQSELGYLFGCYNNNNNRYYALSTKNNNGIRFALVSRTNAVNYVQLVDEEKHTLVFNGDGQTAYFDNNLIVSGGAYDLTARATRPIYLFGRCESIDVLKDSISARIHDVAFIEKSTSTEAGHFIPCYRKADGEIGFYDLTTNSFLANAGTGSLAKGADVN
ncbi:MAG: hypothetical protein IIU04_08150 [Bacteroidales bacterium]|nr:hypothetical protein [Bacteroidales bacterium]